MIRIPGLKGVNPSLNCSGLMTLFRCDIVPVCDAAILPGKDIEKLTCRVYRIQKAEGFNNSDLSTVRTLVKEIKSEG